MLQVSAGYHEATEDQETIDYTCRHACLRKVFKNNNPSGDDISSVVITTDNGTPIKNLPKNLYYINSTDKLTALKEGTSLITSLDGGTVT